MPASTDAIALHADGTITVWDNDAGHRYDADGTRLGAAGSPPPPPALDGGGHARLADGTLFVEGPDGAARCSLPVAEPDTKARFTVAYGGNRVAVAFADTVLVVDARTCAPVGIVPVAGGGKMAVSDTRLVAWRTTVLEAYTIDRPLQLWSTTLPMRCSTVLVSEAGPAAMCGTELVSLPSGRVVARDAELLTDRDEVLAKEGDRLVLRGPDGAERGAWDAPDFGPILNVTIRGPWLLVRGARDYARIGPHGIDRLRIDIPNPAFFFDGTVASGSGTSLSVVPPPVVAEAPARSASPGVAGWRVWENGVPLGAPFGDGEGAAWLDPASGLAVVADRGFRGRRADPTLLAAYATGDGRALWTAAVQDATALRVAEGAVVVRAGNDTHLYERGTGRLVWTVTLDGDGPERVSITAGSVTCRLGEATCPAWDANPFALPTPTGTLTPLPPVPRVLPGTKVSAALGALRDAIGVPLRAVDRTKPPPTLTPGAPHERCGETVGGDYDTAPAPVPLRASMPTLLLVGQDDDYEAPQGVDLVVVGVQDGQDALNDDDPGDVADRPLGARVVYTDVVPRADDGRKDPRAAWPLGLYPGEGLLVAGDCAVLARGSIDEVVTAAEAWALGQLGVRLPKKVAATTWARDMGVRVDSVHPLADGSVAWVGWQTVGVLGPDGAPRWTHTGPKLRLLVAEGEVWESDDRGVRQLDPATGATRREVPGASTVSARAGDVLLVEVGEREQAVLDAATLAERWRLRGLRSGTRLDAEATRLAWSPLRSPRYACAWSNRDGAPLGCGPTDAAALGPDASRRAVGALTLTLDRGTLVATDARGTERWRLGGVWRLFEGDGRTATVQLLSGNGPLVRVNARGRLVAWLPADGYASGPFGVRRDTTIARWDR